MHELRKKRKFRKLIYSRGVIFLLAVIAILLFRGSLDVYKKKVHSVEDLEKVSKAMDIAKNKEAALIESLESLDTIRGKESEVRDRFNVTKPGEKVVLIVEDSANSSGESEKPEGFWPKVKNFFGSILGD